MSPPGPRLWCANGCGLWVDNVGEPGINGAVLVLLGHEPFWFCGLTCASVHLEQMRLTVYERESLPPEAGDQALFMLFNTLSEN